MRSRERRHRPADRVDIPEITRFESHVCARRPQLARDLLAILDIEVEEPNPRLLAREGADDFHADPGGTAGHDDRGALETGIDGKRSSHRTVRK